MQADDRAGHRDQVRLCPAARAGRMKAVTVSAAFRAWVTVELQLADDVDPAADDAFTESQVRRAVELETGVAVTEILAMEVEE